MFILNWLAKSVIHDQPRILFLTKYARGGASSRYRTFLYLPFFEQAGIEFRVSSLFDERYLDHRHRSGSGSAADLFRAVVRRLAALLTVRRFDLVVFEKELLPYFPDLPERILVRSGVPYVVDIDDALFHQYDMHKSWMVRVLLGKKIAHVMRDARLVIAGNSYLADYAQRAGASRVEILPTVIDLERYRPDFSARRRSGIFTIGWIGSPSTAKYLQLVAPALAEICASIKTRVLLVGSGPVEIPGVAVDVRTWGESDEVAMLHEFDVGIMPLPDEPWERGKCGLKLIQYMACRLPVVASPVGVNRQLVEQNGNGFLAHTTEGWVRSLRMLARKPDLRHRMGEAGRKRVEKGYSLQTTGPRMVSLLGALATRRK